MKVDVGLTNVGLTNVGLVNVGLGGDAPGGDLPGQVMNMTLIPMMELVQVSWDPVVSDPPVTHYIVEHKLDTDTVWIPVNVGNVTTYDQTGLVGGTTHDFRVFAVNSVGAGAASEEASAVPTSSLSSPLVQYNDLGIDPSAQVGFYNNTGSGGSSYDMVVFGTAANMTLDSRNGKNVARSTGTAGFQDATASFVGQPYTIVHAGVMSVVDANARSWFDSPFQANFHITATSHRFDSGNELVNSAPGTTTPFIVVYTALGASSTLQVYGASNSIQNGDAGTGPIFVDSILWDKPMTAGRDVVGTHFETDIYIGSVNQTFINKRVLELAAYWNIQVAPLSDYGPDYGPDYDTVT